MDQDGFISERITNGNLRIQLGIDVLKLMSDATAIGVRPATPSRRPLERGDFSERLRRAVDRGAACLTSLQAREGYWCGELEADTTLESDYIFYLHLLGRAEPARITRLANYVRRRQLPDGGWNTYVGGPAELNATVKGYVGLRLAGDAAEAPHMVRAAQRARELGGLEATNSFVRYYLALAGVIGWDMVPAIPPELMLLPSWFPVNLYEMSSWTRGIVAPLTILWALKPGWRLPKEVEVDRLYRDPARRRAAFAWSRRPFTWRNVFLAIDRGLKLYERLPWKPGRKRAVAEARRWMTQHLEGSDGLAAIYPAIMNSIFALLALGVPAADPLVAREIGHLAALEIAEGDTIRMQPCFSPVWDTAIAMVSLEEAGLAADHPALGRAAEWLLASQVAAGGDWQVKTRTEPGGWAFEFRNDFYPDVDDTAFVLMALGRVAYPDRARLEQAMRRGVRWLLAMQNRDGGWGAFDRNNNRRLLTQIPFADHNAMIDPSTADVTARVVECLGQMGWPSSHPVLARAWRFLHGDQTPEGAWYGRWGVNFIYGTSGVMRALEAAGMAGREECRRAAAWLRSVQNADGGFGESVASYDDPALKGRGDTTASQTAWALIGLLAAAGPDDPAACRAAEHLLRTQKPDGSWDEPLFTGTGFPRVFYLRYHLYRISFPLYALARYRNLIEGTGERAGVRLLPEHLAKNGA
ncbi:MAG TPA: squalene--hopene cyclase [Candidatus Acidoferrales bacterium]|nr:squalene--hopene cyclase [Candidatus Acidoferrales bacterium]